MCTMPVWNLGNSDYGPWQVNMILFVVLDDWLYIVMLVYDK
jgi:hypothetical protein